MYLFLKLPTTTLYLPVWSSQQPQQCTIMICILQMREWMPCDLKYPVQCLREMVLETKSHTLSSVFFILPYMASSLVFLIWLPPIQPAHWITWEVRGSGMGLVAPELNFKNYFQTSPIQFQERGKLLTLMYIDGSVKWHSLLEGKLAIFWRF